MRWGGGGWSYLAGSEGDSVAELHSILLLPVVEPLPADADRHRAQVLIKPEIVLMLWGWGVGGVGGGGWSRARKIEI